MIAREAANPVFHKVVKTCADVIQLPQTSKWKPRLDLHIFHIMFHRVWICFDSCCQSLACGMNWSSHNYFGSACECQPNFIPHIAHCIGNIAHMKPFLCKISALAWAVEPHREVCLGKMSAGLTVYIVEGKYRTKFRFGNQLPSQQIFSY